MPSVPPPQIHQCNIFLFGLVFDVVVDGVVNIVVGLVGNVVVNVDDDGVVGAVVDGVVDNVGGLVVVGDGVVDESVVSFVVIVVDSAVQRMRA